MPRYRLTVSWQLEKTIEITADTPADAVEQVLDLPFPKNGEYIPDSFQIDLVEDLDDTVAPTEEC